jgi:hypothetical protein
MLDQNDQAVFIGVAYLDSEAVSDLDRIVQRLGAKGYSVQGREHFLRMLDAHRARALQPSEYRVTILYLSKPYAGTAGRISDIHAR